MRNFFHIAVASALLLGGATYVFAQTSDTTSSSNSALSKITYPVAELGGCDSRDACKLYCDETSHYDACFAYAQKVGLMSKEKIAAARVILKKQGPGSCGSADECKTYCSDSSHHDECLSFATAHNVIASSTANLIRKFDTGEAPGACKSAATCKMYCSDPINRDECRSFAEENGLTPKTGSSTPMRPPRMSTSTSPEVRGILASTTPGRDRGQELHDRAVSSTTGLKGEVPRGAATTTPHKEAAPQKSVPPKLNNDDLGATILRAFAHLLGF